MVLMGTADLMGEMEGGAGGQGVDREKDEKRGPLALRSLEC